MSTRGLELKINVASIDELLELTNPHDGVGYELRCLLALRDRAIRETGLAEGGRARLRRTIEVEKSSGWWPFRPTLREGAVGTIRRISFRGDTGRMLCEWRPDVEWSHGFLPGRGWGHEHWRVRPGRHTFMLYADEMEAVDA